MEFLFRKVVLHSTRDTMLKFTPNIFKNPIAPPVKFNFTFRE